MAKYYLIYSRNTDENQLNKMNGEDRNYKSVTLWPIFMAATCFVCPIPFFMYLFLIVIRGQCLETRTSHKQIQNSGFPVSNPETG